MAPVFPFPGLPYPAAPAWVFPLTEVSVYLLLALCLWHAWKRGPRAVAYLIGGLTFGILLEYFEVASDSYTYGQFWVMIGRAPHDLPLWVGCAWGVILYTARLYSDALGLPRLAAASFDTLLALNIDLGIDVVAYRLHMWHWDWTPPRNPLTSQWFGIPYGNFIGWITVVFCYSLFSRSFERWLYKRDDANSSRAAIVAAMAIFSSLAALIGSELLLYPVLTRFLGLTSGRRLLLEIALLVVFTVTGWRKRQSHGAIPHLLALWVPCWFHAQFAIFFVVFGFYRENPWLTAATCVNLAIGFALHTNWHGLRSDVSLRAAGSA